MSREAYADELDALQRWRSDPSACPICGCESCENHLRPQVVRFPDRPKIDRDVRINAEMERQSVVREARRRLDAAEQPLIDPETLTLRELIAEPEEPINWRVERLIPAGTRGVAAAQRKAGKTTFAYELARSLVDGDVFLGCYRVEPLVGRLAIIDTEMSRRQSRRWLRDLGIRRTDRVLMVPLRGAAAQLNPVDPLCRAQWAGWLRNNDVEFVIVDCLRPCLDALGLDENRESGLWLTGFDQLLKEAGVNEGLIVHHFGHSAERSRGDSRLRDWPDYEIRIVRGDESDTAARFISAFGRDVHIEEQELAYDPTTRRLSISGGSRSQARSSRALAAVIEVLTAAREPRSGRQIEQALADSDHGREAVRAALRLGVKEKQIVAEDGAHRSRLYRMSASAPVRGSAPDGIGALEGEVVRQCASAYIDTRAPRTRHRTRKGTYQKAKAAHSTPRRTGVGEKNSPATRRKAGR